MRVKLPITFSLFILSLFLLAINAFGHAGKSDDLLIAQNQKLIAQDGIASSWYGQSVAVSGNTAVVGAYNARVANNDGQGAAYVYIRNGSQWEFQQKLTANDGAFNDIFGISVAIDGDTIIVGASHDNNQINGFFHGSAYIFQRIGTVWTQQQKLLPADPSNQKEFGFSVAIFGNTVFVSAQNDNNNFRWVSYVFERSGTTWTQKQKLSASDDQPANGFGFGMVLQENIAFLGATNSGNLGQGQVYVFTKQNNVWLESQILRANDGLESDYFGAGLTACGNMLIVGAGGDDVEGINNRGSIYIFERNGNTWSQQTQIYNPHMISNENFGGSIACSDNMILASASFANSDRGTVYVFERVGTSWSERGEISAENEEVGRRFGTDVALSNGNIIIGAPQDVIGSNVNQGSAYLFNIAVSTAFDFDADNKTDISIFRPANGEWWYQRSSDGQVSAAQFGNGTDRIVPADYTGDGKTDIAVYRPSTGEWFVLRSEDNSFYSFAFGANGDVPVSADFDADQKADAAVYRPSNQTWFISRSGGGTTIEQFGASGDVPVVGDYDGDGFADIAVFRPSTGQWWLKRSNSGTVALTFGTSADTPVQGDFTGDGKTDVAFWRPSSGEWFVLRSEDFSFYAAPFGTNGDIPVAGDYDGDGRFDLSVFRPTQGVWYLQRSSAGFIAQQFGVGADKPVPSAFIP